MPALGDRRTRAIGWWVLSSSPLSQSIARLAPAHLPSLVMVFFVDVRLTRSGLTIRTAPDSLFLPFRQLAPLKVSFILFYFMQQQWATLHVCRNSKAIGGSQLSDELTTFPDRVLKSPSALIYRFRRAMPGRAGPSGSDSPLSKTYFVSRSRLGTRCVRVSYLRRFVSDPCTVLYWWNG